MNAGVNRREFLATVAAAQGAFVLGFWVPSRADAQTTDNADWYQDPATPEINASGLPRLVAELSRAQRVDRHRARRHSDDSHRAD